MEFDFEFVAIPVVKNLGPVSIPMVATNKLYSMIL
jgi:hypothetical protein